MAAPGTLSAEHLAQFDAAQKRGKKLRKAARVAAFGGWTTGLIAGSAVLFVWLGKLFGAEIDYVSLALGGAMGVVAFNEFRGAAMLRRFDQRAPMLLGLNQFLLLAAVLTYCVWNMFFAPKTTEQSSGSAEVDAMMADFGGLETTARLVVYGAVIGGSVLMQGLTALYYFSRSKYLRMYHAETPSWVVEVQKRAA